MICKYCGAIIPDNAVFCSSCGHRLVPDESDAFDEPLLNEEPKHEERPKHEEKPVSSQNRKFVIPIIAALLVIALAVGAFSVIKAVRSKDTNAAKSGDENVADTSEDGAQKDAGTDKTAEFPKPMYINTEDGLILRAGPGTDNEIVYLLSYGEEIQVEKIENGWAYTKVGDNEGWCSAEYLTENKADIKEKEKTSDSNDHSTLVKPSNNAEGGYHGYVNSDDGVNVRCGPGTNYDIIDGIAYNTDVIERGWEEGWVYIEYGNGKFGWMSAEYFGTRGAYGKEKPVIYLYPTRTMDVSVKVKLTDGYFTESIPAGDGDWLVTAEPNGRLTDKASGKQYDYIFWESSDETEYDWSEGYVVAGYEAEDFLSTILPKMGLNRKESAEFIEYWLHRLEKNKYNLITFQTDRYEESAKLYVNPKPDSMLRVFMAFKAIREPISIPSPTIKPFERKGFSVVEWGGAEVK